MFEQLLLSRHGSPCSEKHQNHDGQLLLQLALGSSSSSWCNLEDLTHRSGVVSQRSALQLHLPAWLEPASSGLATDGANCWLGWELGTWGLVERAALCAATRVAC